MLAVERVRAKFADDQRLRVLAIPLKVIGVFGMFEIPPQIFVEAQNVEALADWIIEDSLVGPRIGYVVQRRRDQPCRIELPSCSRQLLQEDESVRIGRRFVRE